MIFASTTKESGSGSCLAWKFFIALFYMTDFPFSPPSCSCFIQSKISISWIAFFYLFILNYFFFFSQPLSKTVSGVVSIGSESGFTCVSVHIHTTCKKKERMRNKRKINPLFRMDF